MGTRHAAIPQASGRWQWLAAAAILLLAVNPVLAQPAPPPSGPSTASLVEAACLSLRTDPTVRARFPGARERLCIPGFPMQKACSDRAIDACSIDALCAVRMTFVCDRQPCPPGGPARASCGVGPDRTLAASILRYRPCVDSGGAWVPLPGVTDTQPWRGACSCMGPSIAAILATREGRPNGEVKSPLTYFVQGRGCVAETTLCKDHRGTWVATPADDPQRARCEIDGRPVHWAQRAG